MTCWNYRIIKTTLVSGKSYYTAQHYHPEVEPKRWVDLCDPDSSIDLVRRMIENHKDKQIKSIEVVE
jgi:hypothetical protein